MPTFTPPSMKESSDDSFFGRFSVDAGVSIVKVNGTYRQQPYPWLGDLVGLTEGLDWFQGGRSYYISADIANALEAAGFTVTWSGGYGLGSYGSSPYGE